MRSLYILQQFEMLTRISVSILLVCHAVQVRYALPLMEEEVNLIVGGSVVPPDQFVPYQISLQFHRTSDVTQHICGGSIISSTRILTAAHCCNGIDPKNLTILAGINNLKAENGIRSNVVGYVVHENYQPFVTGDIAILYIDPPLKLDGERLRPIAVNGTEFVGGGVSVTLTGWGRTFPIELPILGSIFYPKDLRSIQYRTITNIECSKKGYENINDGKICSIGKLVGACSGDSGGPLVGNTKDGLQQIGIVSYGIYICGISNMPDVYTRVSAFREWIEKHL